MCIFASVEYIRFPMTKNVIWSYKRACIFSRVGFSKYNMRNMHYKYKICHYKVILFVQWMSFSLSLSYIYIHTRVVGGGDLRFTRVGSPLAFVTIRWCYWFIYVCILFWSLLVKQVKQWRSSIRYIDPGSSCTSSREWRPSVKTVQTYKGHGEQLRWKPAVRVFKLADCRTEWRMRGGRRHVTSISHDEPIWRSSRGPGRPPQLKWAPPFRNVKLASHNVCKNVCISHIIIVAVITTTVALTTFLPFKFSRARYGILTSLSPF